MRKILVYPYDKNPYQKLLYGNMKYTKAWYWPYFPYVGALPFLVVLVIARICGVKILHIHWPAFTVPWKNSFGKKVSFYLFRFCIAFIKLLGYKTVWTVHNVMPHEAQTSNDRLTAKRISKFTNRKIVHSKFSIEQMNAEDLDINNVKVIPHGNYKGVYPISMSRAEARKSLGISKNEKVILFFGNIRPYKGVEDLVESFNKLSTNTNLRLIIAGKCDDTILNTFIEKHAKNSNIDYYNIFVPDREVQKYFLASDAVCLPFKSITTSGSALLAITFNKPLICPRVGAIKDMPNSIGILYNTKEKNIVEKSLQSFVKLRPPELARMTSESKKYSSTLDWSNISRTTEKIYEDLETNS